MTTFADVATRGSLLLNDGYRTKASELGTPGFPVLRVAEVANGAIAPSYGDHVRREYRDKVGYKLSRAGDVLLTTKGTVGRRAIMPELPAEFAYSPQLCFFRVLDNTIDNRWLYYWLGGSEFWSQALGVSQQTDMAPYISLRDLRAIEVELPPIEEQRGIAGTLSTLDDKIESNRSAIACLEALGSAVLESTLVVDAYGAPEFDSDRRIGDVAAVLETGSRPRGGVVASDIGVISLGAESIQSAGVISTTAFKRVPAEFAAAMRRGRLEDGDVLVYKDGGKPGNFIPHVSAFGQGFPDAVATINEHVYRVRAVDEISQGLLYWILRSPWMDQEMRKRGTGVAIPGLNSTNFRDLPWPELAEQSVLQLNARLEPLLVRMLSLGAESRRLAALRDALLPELLSGRIRVPEGADVVQDVVDESESA